MGTSTPQREGDIPSRVTHISAMKRHTHSPLPLAWNRPTRNGRIPKRRTLTVEPPLWVAVPVIAILGYLLLILGLAF